MQTIFLMFSRSFVVRNILRTNVFAILKSRSDLRFVLFVRPNIPQSFKDEFNDPRIFFEETPELEYGKLRRHIFEPLLMGLIYTDSGKFFARFGGRVGRVLVRPWHVYIFTHIWATLVSSSHLLKRIFRSLELQLFPDFNYDHFFQKYNPLLTIVTTVMSKRDRAMLKASRRAHIPSIGITRGWDNLDRLFLPTIPDKLIVQNEVMKEHAVAFHDVPAKKIAVTGFPQFDLYLQTSIYEPREDFLRKFGLDPDRQMIFYGGEGEWAPHDEHIVAHIVAMIEDNELCEPCSLIIRPHWSDVALKRYEMFRGHPNVHIDDDFRMNSFFTDKWDPDMKEMARLANIFKHCALLVTYVSTLAIEGALFDKPIINIDYYADTEPDRGPYFGRWYKAKHYQTLIHSGAVKLAHSREHLKILLNDALLNPQKDTEARKKLAELMCYKTDGHAGERMADVILTFLDTHGIV